MPLDRSGRESVCNHEDCVQASGVGIGAGEPAGAFRVEPTTQIRPLQEGESILRRAVNRDRLEFQLVEVGEHAGNVERPVYSVTRARMCKLEGKVGTRGKTPAHVSQADPGWRKRAEVRPRICASHWPSRFFLKPSPGPGLGPIQALNSASANGFPGMVPLVVPFTSTRVPSPGK